MTILSTIGTEGTDTDGHGWHGSVSHFRKEGGRYVGVDVGGLDAAAFLPDATLTFVPYSRSLEPSFFLSFALD